MLGDLASQKYFIPYWINDREQYDDFLKKSVVASAGGGTVRGTDTDENRSYYQSNSWMKCEMTNSSNVQCKVSIWYCRVKQNIQAQKGVNPIFDYSPGSVNLEGNFLRLLQAGLHKVSGTDETFSFDAGNELNLPFNTPITPLWKRYVACGKPRTLVLGPGSTISVNLRDKKYRYIDQEFHVTAPTINSPTAGPAGASMYFPRTKFVLIRMEGPISDSSTISMGEVTQKATKPPACISYICKREMTLHKNTPNRKFKVLVGDDSGQQGSPQGFTNTAQQNVGPQVAQPE